MENDEGRGTLLWMTNDDLFFRKASDDLFFGRSTLPSPAMCPAPLNKELGTAASCDRLLVASLLIYPPAESTIQLKVRVDRLVGLTVRDGG